MAATTKTISMAHAASVHAIRKTDNILIPYNKIMAEKSNSILVTEIF